MESIQLAQMLADLSDLNAAVGHDTIFHVTCPIVPCQQISPRVMEIVS